MLMMSNSTHALTLLLLFIIIVIMYLNECLINLADRVSTAMDAIKIKIKNYAISIEIIV